MAEHGKRDILTRDLEVSITVIKRSIAIGVCGLLLTYFTFRWVGDTSFTLDAAVWGALGDFFGGILNPFFSILTIYLLVKSLRLQNQELSDATEQLSQTKKIHAHSLMYEDTRTVFKLRAQKITQIESNASIKVYPSNTGGVTDIIGITCDLEKMKTALFDSESLTKYLTLLTKINHELVDYSKAGLDLLEMGTPAYILRDTMEDTHQIINDIYQRALVTNNSDCLKEGYNLYSTLLKTSAIRFTE